MTIYVGYKVRIETSGIYAIKPHIRREKGHHKNNIIYI